ncbi:MAG: DUF4129 domain-containing protein, partial [Verrucomicrobiota bacterium]
WAQSLGLFLILGLFSFMTWVNLLVACILIPVLGKSFLGVESVFTTNGDAAFTNSTFQFGVLLATYLVISPMLKAVFVLRCFYAESRSTGADLLSKLSHCKLKRSGVKVALVIGMGVATILGCEVIGQESAPISPAVQMEQMDSAIRDVMAEKRHQWKLPRSKNASELDSGGNWFTQQIDNLNQSIEDAYRRAKERVKQWYERMEQKPSKAPNERSPNSQLPELGSALSIVLGILLVALLGWVVFLVVRNAKTIKKDLGEGAEIIGEIDLESEEIVADQLPEDEWMKLANEKLAKGDVRLAVRALFLATLAHLGEKGWLRIAKFKSNRDYSRELLLKARHLSDMRAAFADNTLLFESTWYGLHKLNEEGVNQFKANYESIKELTSEATV